MNPATITDTLVRSGGLRDDPIADPIGFSSQLASDLYEIIYRIAVIVRACASTIVQNPYLLFMFGFAVLGIAISVFGYLLRRD